MIQTTRNRHRPLPPTLGHFSPEWLLGLGNRSLDMWGVGYLVHVLLVGYEPFKAENEQVMFERVRRESFTGQVKSYSSPIRLQLGSRLAEGGLPTLRDSLFGHDLILSQILDADLNLIDEGWDQISLETKDFVARLLRAEPTERLTAEQALVRSNLFPRHVPALIFLSSPQRMYCKNCVINSLTASDRTILGFGWPRPLSSHWYPHLSANCASKNLNI